MEELKDIVYLPAVLKKRLSYTKQRRYLRRFKDILKWKERFNPQREKEKISTDLESAWVALTEEKCLHVEEQKEERNFLYLQKTDTNTNMIY